MATQVSKVVKQYRSWKKGNFAPSYVELLVSSRCNLKCVMCNVWPIIQKDPSMAQKEVDLETYRKLFDELASMGTKSLCISGGEPLLRNDIFSIFELAKKKNFIVELITNGTLITPQIAEKIINSGIDLVTISIDGPTPEIHDKIRGANGLFEQSTKGLQALHKIREEQNKQKPILAIDYVFTKMNYRFIPDMIDLKSKLGFDEIHLLPVIGRTPAAKELFLSKEDLSWLNENLILIKSKMEQQNLPTSKLSPLVSVCDDFEESSNGRYKILNVRLSKKAKKGIQCFAAWTQATIDPFGNVYPCCYACTFQNSSEDLSQTCWGDKDFPMGNITEKTFGEIWKGTSYQEFRENCNKNRYNMCRCCGYDFSNSLVLTTLLVNRKFIIRHPRSTYQVLKKYRADGH